MSLAHLPHWAFLLLVLVAAASLIANVLLWLRVGSLEGRVRRGPEIAAEAVRRYIDAARKESGAAVIDSAGKAQRQINEYLGPLVEFATDFGALMTGLKTAVSGSVKEGAESGAAGANQAVPPPTASASASVGGQTVTAVAPPQRPRTATMDEQRKNVLDALDKLAHFWRVPLIAQRFGKIQALLVNDRPAPVEDDHGHGAGGGHAPSQGRYTPKDFGLSDDHDH